MKTAEAKEFLEEHKQGWAFIAVTVLATLLLIGLFAFFSSPTRSGEVFVPPDFLEARSRAGGLADELADLTREEARDIQAIAEADQAGDFETGLRLARDASGRNPELRQVMVNLSEELSRMALTIDRVEPEEARVAASTAVVAGVELVRHMVSYNNYVQDLLTAAEARLQAGGAEAGRERIEELTRLINEEAGAVNDLNAEYRGLMLQFDALTE